MKHKEGYILKSVEGGKKGKNEVRFYEELKSDDSLINLRTLVPSYFGTVTVKINSKGKCTSVDLSLLFSIYCNEYKFITVHNVFFYRYDIHSVR